MPNYKINIPEPCHEKWGEMTPTGRGAFCAVCKKDVVDFTGLTTVELRDYLRKNQIVTCGKFTKTQLEANYSIEIEKPYTNRFYKGWLAAAAALFLSVFNAKAEAKNAPSIEWVEDKISGDGLLPVIADEPTDTGDIYIRGKMLINDTSAALGAVVKVEGSSIGAAADFDGNFKFVLPKQLIGKPLILIAQSYGYKPVTVDLGIVNKQLAPLHISFTEIEAIDYSDHVMGAMRVSEIHIDYIDVVLPRKSTGDIAKSRIERFYFGNK